MTTDPESGGAPLLDAVLYDEVYASVTRLERAHLRPLPELGAGSDERPSTERT